MIFSGTFASGAALPVVANPAGAAMAAGLANPAGTAGDPLGAGLAPAGVWPGGGTGGVNFGANSICQISRMSTDRATAIIPLRSIWE
jgi:hypothetical protein